MSSPDDDTYTVNVTVNGSPADPTQQTQAFNPSDPLDVSSTVIITITDDMRGDTARTSLNRVAFKAPGAETVTISVITPQEGEQNIQVIILHYILRKLHTHPLKVTAHWYDCIQELGHYQDPQIPYM